MNACSKTNALADIFSLSAVKLLISQKRTVIMFEIMMMSPYIQLIREIVFVLKLHTYIIADNLFFNSKHLSRSFLTSERLFIIFAVI